MIDADQLRAWWAEQDPCANPPPAFVMSPLQYVVARALATEEMGDADLRKLLQTAEEQGHMRALAESEDTHADIEAERAHRQRAEQSEVEARAELATLRAEVAAMKRGDIFTRLRRRVSMAVRDR